MKKEEYAAQPLATLKELAKGRKMRGTSTMKKSDLIEALMAYDAAHAESVEKAAESAEEKSESGSRGIRTVFNKRAENTQTAEQGNSAKESTAPAKSTNLRNRRVNRPVSGSNTPEGKNENREPEKRSENYSGRNTAGTVRREFTGGEITRSGGRFRRNESDTRRQEYSGQQDGRRERTGMNRTVRRDNTQSSNYRRDSQEAGYTGYSSRFSYRNNIMAGQFEPAGENAEQAGNASYRRQEQRTDGESRQSGADTYQAQRAMEEDHTYQRSQSAEMEGRTNNMDAIRSQGQRNDAAEADQEQNTGASQVQDLRSDDRPSQDLSALDSGQEACGILEVMTEGFGFIRSDNFMSGDNDVYVSPSQIRRFGLRTGDMISGNTRIKTMQEKYSALLYLKTINGMAPSEAMKRSKFEDMTPVFPNERLCMERGSSGIAMRIVDLFSPIGKGQRGMIVSPPKAGKTTLLKDVAHSILENDPKMQLIILLIDERPEEVTDIKEAICGDNVEVIYSTFDEQPEHHKRVSEMVIERAKRLVEQKMDVTILLDSITRLARAYNLTVPPSGRTLSGGLDPAALYMPKRFFGAARNMREGGSLTILATALVDTGSKMDDVVYEEFKGTGNMELVLDRKLSERRVFPAIDIPKSGTRREDLLLDKEEQEAVYIMRRALNGMKSEDAVENILNLFVHTRTNRELVTQVRRQRCV